MAAAKAAVTQEPKLYHLVAKRPDYHNYQVVFDRSQLRRSCLIPFGRKIAETRSRSTGGSAGLTSIIFISSEPRAWIFAVSTSEGIIVIDTNYDWDIKELVPGLLCSVSIRRISSMPSSPMLTMTATGEPRCFRHQSSVHIIMSGPDWDLLAKNNDPARAGRRKI